MEKLQNMDMAHVIGSTLALLIASFSLPLGYIISAYTSDELRAVARHAKITNLTGALAVVVEAFILTFFLAYSYDAFFFVVGAVIVFNLGLSALHTERKDDMAMLFIYQVLFLVLTITASLTLLL